MNPITDDGATGHPDTWSEAPASARDAWHREAAERDETYLDDGPADLTESMDGPWSGWAVES
jgi:hypothetical protein